MSSKATITHQDGTLHVAGVIDFFTAERLWEQSLPMMAPADKLQFDFSKVNSANSAALALLVEWFKYAKKQQKQISFYQLPSKLISVATIAGLGGLLHESYAISAH